MKNEQTKFRVFNKFFVLALMLLSILIIPAPAQAQAGANNIYLPVLAGGSGAGIEAVGPFASVPTVDLANAEVTAASDDLGCVNYEFGYQIDGVMRRWNGNWHIGHGGSGPIVKLLQWHLVYTHGQDIGNFGPHGDGVDGYYGSRTVNAVRNVQQNFRYYGFQACGRQITIDGFVGPQTWALLFTNK